MPELRFVLSRYTGSTVRGHLRSRTVIMRKQVISWKRYVIEIYVPAEELQEIVIYRIALIAMTWSDLERLFQLLDNSSGHKSLKKYSKCHIRNY